MSDPDKLPTRQSLLEQIDETWNNLQSYIGTLSPQELTEPTDAAGWAAKDHLAHLAAWEKAVLALLEGKSKREALDITPEVWEQDDDPINAVIQQRYQHMPVGEVFEALSQTHEQVMSKLHMMTEDDLLLPYKHYQSSSSDERPLIQWLPWETVYHYRDHMTWMAAIVGR